MNKIYALLICLATNVAMAQKDFVLKGSTNYTQFGYAVLGQSHPIDALYNYSIKNDSVKIVNGAFTFSGKLTYPQLFYIKLISKNKEFYTEDFFIDTTTQRLNINTSVRSKNYLGIFPNGVIIKNSATNNEFFESYLPLFTSLNKKVEFIFDHYEPKDDATTAKFIKQRDSCRLVRDSILLSYSINHKNSNLVPWMLFEHIRRYGYKESYQNAFDSISWNSKELRDAINNFLSRKRDVDIGKILPHKKELIDEFIDNDTAVKYVLVDFWFSGCFPCLRQFEHLRDIYTKYNLSGFKIVAVSTDNLQNKEAYEMLLIQKKYPWYQKLDTGALIANKLYIDKFPSNFLLDNDGRIIAIDIDPVQLNRFLEKSLKIN